MTDWVVAYRVRQRQREANPYPRQLPHSETLAPSGRRQLLCARCGKSFWGTKSYCSDRCKKETAKERKNGVRGSVYRTMTMQERTAFQRWLDRGNGVAREFQRGLRNGGHGL